MKKLTVILIAAMFIVSIAPAYCMGDVVWQREFDTGVLNESVYGVAVDTNNNVIIAGYNSDTIVKYDSNGNKIWDQATISDPNSVAVDSSNNIFVGGNGGVAKYGPNGGAALASANPGLVQDIAVDSSNNIVVITGTNNIYKYNSNLNLLAGPISSTINAVSVAVDSNNNIIVAGYKDEGSDRSLKVLKFDTNGNLLWTKTYDVVGVNDYAYGVAVDPNNNIIATGVSGNEMLNIKYSLAGNQLWVKTYKEGANDTVGYSVSTDNIGNIFVAGLFKESSQDNWLVVKYDGNGNFGWKSVNPGNSKGFAYDITTDSNNNIIAAGYGWKGSGLDYTDYFLTVKYQAEPKKKSLPIEFILKILQKNKNK
ncbi:MAG: hypothetical protein HPY60_01025 [Candidatus Methanofastidiosum sp.]|nr:hypothetical protein [Methanofastidiosum sp.]NYT13881.1 hypothetical protein [Candidatus Methanofastidiosa archaeon]